MDRVGAITLFSNKMNTLLYLKDKLSASSILDMYSFLVSEYEADKGAIINHISALFTDEIIIRSSASTEDQFSTNAGHFLSAQHVNARDISSIKNGIETVISSYRKDGLTNAEYIFVQKQLCDVMLSGVALSFEPECGKPYFLVNYDDDGSTDSVTSGRCNKFIYIARDYKGNAQVLEQKLCAALLEIESLCNDEALNVEFAITKDESVFIFQVRRLKLKCSTNDSDEILIYKNNLAQKYVSNDELLSDMAFWNPSEIIGDDPHPLDYSLYRYLVTDRAWNDGIAGIGYYETNEHLMTQIGNKPYIRLPIAFSALTPVTISNSLRKKLVEYYTHLLYHHPNLHDKIEFEIVLTCFDNNAKHRLDDLTKYGFAQNEIDELQKNLVQMTEDILENYNTILTNDLSQLRKLMSAISEAKPISELRTIDDMVLVISELLYKIRAYGVVPFARQARCAFIARELCLSLVSEGRLTSNQLNDFMFSIKTTAGELHADVISCLNQSQPISVLKSKYGHLRANTYDISSLTYNEVGFERIFTEASSVAAISTKNVMSKDLKLDVVLQNQRVDITSFVRNAIEQREYFKFIFTKALSYVIEVIAKMAEKLAVSREEISYITVDDILDLAVTYDATLFRNKILNNKKRFKLCSRLILPSIITDVRDFHIIKMMQSDPNFITDKCVEGDILILTDIANPLDVMGKIVVIQNADPGFDWIFATNSIAGLITKYGGMASHMAIRCMEFSIPAAIGCGDIIYDNIIKGKRAYIDGASKKVGVVS